ncbi:MAG TPA: S8 family serine peptidase [Pseudolabrys sp.]|nr:S8 family serine peptidase [Pseudolabrys sp.]
MRAMRNRLLLALTIGLLSIAFAGKAAAQFRPAARAPGAGVPPSRGDGGGYHGGRNGLGVGLGVGTVLGILSAMPPAGGQYGGVPDGQYIGDGDGAPPTRRRPPRRSSRRGASGAPPANERRYVPDEVVIEVPNSITPQAISALERRHRLTRLESQQIALTNRTLFRWRIPDRRSVATVVRALEGDRVVSAAQPNYLYTLQEDASPKAAAPAEGDAAQYELAKLHLPQAHSIAKGDGVLVAVIDSGIDASHPELAGAIAATFDTLESPFKPHFHGTAIAGLIAAHSRLMGAAPGARILAARAFDPAGDSAKATTFNILKSLDWAAANKARIVNMSFAGPADPAIHRSLEAAYKKGIVLIAAAGNAGAKSPPLYPAAYAEVIAVSATTADDKLFEASNRGKYIAVAAPGADILVAVPDASYQVQSGTSFSAAEISGIAALMIAHKPDIKPAAVRAVLLATAKDLGPKGRDNEFGAGIADAYRAVTEETAPPKSASKAKRPRKLIGREGD